MATTSSQPSVDMVFRLRLPPPMFVPALVTRMSMRPCRFSMSAAVAATAALSATSSSVASALPAFFNSASALSLVGALRPEMTAWAPARASSSAPASPMPLPPPVIQATLPFSAAAAMSALLVLGGPEEHFLLLRRHLRPAPVGEPLESALHGRAGQQAVAPALHSR